MPKYKKDWWEKAKQFKVELIDEKKLVEMLSKCQNEFEKICLILLYYTGARPSELVNLKWKNIELDKNKVKITLPTTKKGIGRTIFLPLNDYTKILIEERQFKNGEWYILPYQKGYRIRDLIYRLSNNELTAYFFRHNRLSQLALAGVDIHTLKYFKGAKSLSSVEDYIHLGGLQVRRIANKIK